VRGPFRNAKAPLERPTRPEDAPGRPQDAKPPVENTALDRAFDEALTARTPLERPATPARPDGSPAPVQEKRPDKAGIERAFEAALAAQEPFERPAALPTGDDPEATLGTVFAARTLNPELGQWVAARRRALQQQHATQQARLMKELDKALFPARQAIDNAANPKISAALRALQAIEERQQAPGLAGRFARLQHPNDPQRAEALQRELEAIRTRRDRALEELEREKETHERTRALRDRQAQESADFEIYLARVIESGRVPENANENRPPTSAQAEERERAEDERDDDQALLEQGRGGRSRAR